MPRKKKDDYVSNAPTGGRTITLELEQDNWETLIWALQERRIFFEQRRSEAIKFHMDKTVAHYNEMIEVISDILISVYRQVDAGHYATQIQALKESQPSWPQLRVMEAS